MVCTTCGLDNDPGAFVCARCNSVLSVAPSHDAGPQYGPPSPAPPAHDYRTRPAGLLPLLAGLSVLVLLALVAGLVVYRHHDSNRSAAPTAPPATTTTAAPFTAPPATVPTTPVAAADPLPQAEALDAVLDRSSASRDKLNRAIGQVSACADPAGALADMQAVANERQSQITTVQNADLSALANGETLRTDLVAALQQSLNADQSFMDWAEPAASGSCATTAARRAAYARGRSASDLAGTAKQTFLAEWNPVAEQLGLPFRSRQAI